MHRITFNEITKTAVKSSIKQARDLFREGQGVVVQGELEKGNHILAKEVLAKHDENYTPPEVEKAMEANHRRPASVYKDPAS